MVKCPKCGSKNDKSNNFCLECGTNLKSTLKNFKFDKKAIGIGIIVWIPLFIIWSWVYIPLNHTVSVYNYAYSLTIVQFISGFIVALIFSIPLVLLGGIIPLFITIVIFGAIGGGLGGYIKLQTKLNML